MRDSALPRWLAIGIGWALLALGVAVFAVVVWQGIAFKVTGPLQIALFTLAFVQGHLWFVLGAGVLHHDAWARARGPLILTLVGLTQPVLGYGVCRVFLPTQPWIDFAAGGAVAGAFLIVLALCLRRSDVQGVLLVPVEHAASAEAVLARKPASRWNLIRRLYDWVIGWANSPYGEVALFVLAVAESSFFPIPPDVLLIALGLGFARRSFRYALTCSVGSVLGGIGGYAIGVFLYDLVGRRIIEVYHVTEQFEHVRVLFRDNAFAAVAIAGFTPVPYKVFTIAGGVCRIDLWTFILSSAISRSARFVAVAALVYVYGPAAKRFLEKHFEWITVLITLGIIGGFLAIKWVS